MRGGKVRDVYDLGKHLLIVATDRISAFDCVMPNPIPGKGILLTKMSLFWFDMMDDIVPNHLVTADVSRYPAKLQKYADQLEGRSMLVKKAERVDLECVARGYLAGSGWKEYGKTGAVCGHTLPEGLRESDRLPKPIFTPATKADSGHDENISVEEAANRFGRELVEELQSLTLEIYERGRTYAESRDIIIADTKFEFGYIDGRIALIDEILSPDSSRFWPRDDYQPGRSQNSYDKAVCPATISRVSIGDKTPPAPELPAEIVEGTLSKYRDAYEKLVGSPIDIEDGSGD